MSRGSLYSRRTALHVLLPVALLCPALVLFAGAASAGPPAAAPDAGLRALQAADPALTRLAAAYYAALARAEADACAGLWSPASPEAARGREAAQKFLAAHGPSELASLTLERAEAGGGWAWIRVTADLRPPGAAAAAKGRLDPTRRALRCRFEEGAWRIWDERPAAEDLATALIAARTDADVSALLAGLQESETAGLPAALTAQSLASARKGDLDTALRIAQLSRRLAEATGNRTDLAEALNREGTVWGMKGRYDRAVARLEEAVRTWPPGETARRSSSLFNLGRALHGQGEYDRALACYRECLAEREAAGDSRGIEGTLQNMGTVYYDIGNYRAALETYLRALSLISPDDRAATAKALLNIGNIHSRQGDQSLALDHYGRALELLQPLAPHPYIAVVENNIGSAYQRLQDHSRALAHLQKSLALRNPQEPEGIAHVLGNIAASQFALGNSGEAEKSWRESLRLFEQIDQPFGIAWIRGDLAYCYLETSRPAEALAEAERSVEVARSRGQADLLSEAHTAAGSAHLALGQPEEARRDFDEAIQATEEMRTRLAGGEQARESFFEERLSPYQQMVSLLVRQGRPVEALAYAERAKARVLGEILRGGRVRFDRFMTPEERDEDRRLAAELASLNSRLASAGGDDDALAELQESQRQARLRLEEFRHRLYAAHPELAVARGESAPPEPAGLPALVPDSRAALLEYVVLPETTYLFVLTRPPGRAAPEAAVHVIGLGEPALAERVRDFRERITGGDPAAGRPAQALYDLLIRPAEAQLRGRTRLVITPDGVLWDLPFAALQPDPDRVLLEDCALDTVPSLGVWKQMRDRQTGGDPGRGRFSLLAFGNPRLAQAEDRQRFVPLPEAEAEVRTLPAIYGPEEARVYTGIAADESRFKAEAPQARILHLATHGVLDGASPLYSYLALAPGGNGEDGLLEAREILEMELGADVAVLSACETARGRIGAGEGVIGLSWALFVSGCATTVVSLWPVESAATTELMVEFHRGLRQSAPAPLPPAEALRQAALEIRKRPATRHPFYWAGFLTVGKGF